MGLFDVFKKDEKKPIGLPDAPQPPRPFQSSKPEGEYSDYTELDFESLNNTLQPRYLIMVEELNSSLDTDRIMKKVRAGHILMVKNKLSKDEPTELRAIFSKLKNQCANLGGDVVAVQDDWLVLTPNAVRVIR